MGHNTNVTQSVTSMSSICLTCCGTSWPHKHHQVVNCHCWMFSRSSWRVICSLSLFAGSGCRRWIAWSRTSQMSSIGDKSGEYAGQPNTGTFSSSRNSLHTWATWGLALSWWKIVLYWQTIGCCISSQYLSTFRLPAMACSCVRCPWDIGNVSIPPIPRHTCCRPSALWSWKRVWSLEGTFLHCSCIQQMCLLTQASRCRYRAGVRSYLCQGWRTRRLPPPFVLDSLR